MLAFDPKIQSELASSENHRIRVLGVGGAGVNMLDRIKLNNVRDLDLCVANTDQRALQASVVDDRVQLGAGLTRGLGSGGDPDLGHAAFEASAEEMFQRMQERDLVFLCGGLGGGTASGALPAVAQMAREAGAFVVAFVTMPFFFEGRRRAQQAQEALEKLNMHAHALMTFPNDRMSELVDGNEGIHSAFSKVDQLIAAAVSSISNMISRPGLVHLGLDDLITALEDNRHECLFGWGEARGKKRVEEAVSQALKSPLLEKEKLANQASKVLVHVCGGQDLSLHEVEQVMTEITRYIHPEAHVLFGTGVDPQQDALQVTLISSLGNTPLADFETERLAAQPEAGLDLDAHDALAAETAAESLVETGENEVDDYGAASKQQMEDFELEGVEQEGGDSSLITEAVQQGAKQELEVEAELAPSPSEQEPAVEQALSEANEVAASETEAIEENLAPEQEAKQEVSAEPEAEEAPYTEAEIQQEPPVEELNQAAAKAEESAAATQASSTSSKPDESTQEPKKAKPAEGVKLVRKAKGSATSKSSKTKQDPTAERKSEAAQAGDLFASTKPEKRGRFADSDPTLEDGEDLDLPTFLRKKKD